MAPISTNAPPAATLTQQVPPVKPQIKEFSIILAKQSDREHSLMKFNKELKVEFKSWTQANLQRENNERTNTLQDEMPKFGAGSEFGREKREEARRKRKFGIMPKKHSENRPWILQTNTEAGKQSIYKGFREGGISANAAYYVFKQSRDGSIEAYPLHEWYNFQSIPTYKALSAEEAEEEFLRRDKTLNYFNVMMRKRLRSHEDADGEAKMLESNQKCKKKDNDFKISEMDEWIDCDDEEGSDEQDGKNETDGEYCDKKKEKGGKKKNKKKVPSDEACEESDDGDEEGRECEYISDSSASEDELELQKQIKSVDEEHALRRLLVSDDEEEEEKRQVGDGDNTQEINGKAKKITKTRKQGRGSASLVGSKSAAKTNKTRNPNMNVKAKSLKRSQSCSLDLPHSKRSKLGTDHHSPELLATSADMLPGSIEHVVTEDVVRRYLLRKPMTVTDLLLKFKSKKTGISSDQIGVTLTNILIKMKPSSKIINGKKAYFIAA